MKKVVCLTFIIFLFGDACFSQLKLLKTYKMDQPGIAAVDYIGNYYVQNNSDLWMFNRFDTLYRKFSIINLAELSNIDASNALKIQLYYKELGKVLYIDNNISDFTTAVSLNDMGLAQATLVCSSFDNGFWSYLPSTMSLYRYDQHLNRVVDIESVSRFMKIVDLEPGFMKEYSNSLYLYFPDYGMLVFDIFGAFVQTIPTTELIYPDIQSGELIHFNRDTLYFQSLPDMTKTSVLPLPHHDGLVSVRYSSGKVYMLTGQNLFIYKL